MRYKNRQSKKTETELNLEQKDKYNAIKKLIETKGNKNAAALRFGCSIRTINRLIQKFHTIGQQGFIHGNTGKVPVNKKYLKDKIFQLFTSDDYDGSNITHFCELIEERESIFVSECYVRTVLKSKCIL